VSALNHVDVVDVHDVLDTVVEFVSVELLAFVGVGVVEGQLNHVLEFAFDEVVQVGEFGHSLGLELVPLDGAAAVHVYFLKQVHYFLLGHDLVSIDDLGQIKLVTEQ